MLSYLAVVVLSLISAVTATELATCIQNYSDSTSPHFEKGVLAFGNSDTYSKAGNHLKSVQTVNFTKPYVGAAPQVMLSVLHLDINKSGNTRYIASTGEITTTGTQIIFETWDDTKVYGATVAWLAFKN
ncbi:uncharacterized protein LOC131950633 [Physella acuta]|uniref:uncharacterized protein LOC131950633 n=1 Tax=Physella acuta TaxID=109671 RepID=UPI0027DB39FB|nr:uncharacterized protein LOC131950633 [Physella acuta]